MYSDIAFGFLGFTIGLLTMWIIIEYVFNVNKDNSISITFLETENHLCEEEYETGALPVKSLGDHGKCYEIETMLATNMQRDADRNTIESDTVCASQDVASKAS